MRGHFTVDHHLAAVSALLHRVAQQAAPSP
jgi:hypothetical protein